MSDGAEVLAAAWAVVLLEVGMQGCNSFAQLLAEPGVQIPAQIFALGTKTQPRINLGIRGALQPDISGEARKHTFLTALTH